MRRLLSLLPVALLAAFTTWCLVAPESVEPAIEAVLKLL